MAKEWIAVLRAADAAARWHVHPRARFGPCRSALADEVLDVIEDGDRIRVSGHGAARSRATYVFDPAILYARMHRFAAHDGIRREPWLTHSRNDDDAFASI